MTTDASKRKPTKVLLTARRLTAEKLSAMYERLTGRRFTAAELERAKKKLGL